MFEDHFQHTREGGYDFRANTTVDLSARGRYSTDILTAEAVAVITRHFRDRDEAAPLFLYLPYQAVHAPLEAPAAEFARTRRTGSEPRDVYRAMLARLDRGVGTIVKTLKDLGAWDNTLLVFSTDNGGAVSQVRSYLVTGVTRRCITYRLSPRPAATTHSAAPRALCLRAARTEPASWPEGLWARRGDYCIYQEYLLSIRLS